MFALRHDAILEIGLRAGVGFAIATVITSLALRLRALTVSGAFAAVIIGTLAFTFGGILVAAAVIIFFASATTLGHFHGKRADAARGRSPKSAQRDAAQVFANGGIAVACAIAGMVAAHYAPASASRWMIAAIGALAAASGDTWSTEIGAFSPGSAWLITSLRPVVPGTSGGITLLGTMAAPLGGALVGLAGVTRPDLLGVLAWVAVGAGIGLVGSAIDSVLGATMQAMWRCPNCGQLMETPTHACGRTADLVRGLPWLNNDAVNAVATVSGAVLGYLLAGVRVM